MNNFDYLFGASNLFAGVYLFLIVFNIYKPKHKTEEQAVKANIFFEKYSILFKIIAIVLILRGVYVLLGY